MYDSSPSKPYCHTNKTQMYGNQFTQALLSYKYEKMYGCQSTKCAVLHFSYHILNKHTTEKVLVVVIQGTRGEWKLQDGEHNSQACWRYDERGR